MICDLDKIARLFRVTEKAVRGWLSAGMPVHQLGTQGGARKKTRIKLEAAVEWYFKENFERLELDRQRSRLSSEQADKAALDNQERRGDLVSLKAIEREYAGVFTEIRINALAIPSKLAPEVTGLGTAEIKAALERAIFELLDRAAQWEPDSYRIAASGAELPAPAAAADHQRVGRQAPHPKSGGGRLAGAVENQQG
jgi:phage terminase Nu1 subunit (DNA packaging protein)